MSVPPDVLNLSTSIAWLSPLGCHANSKPAVSTLREDKKSDEAHNPTTGEADRTSLKSMQPTQRAVSSAG